MPRKQEIITEDTFKFDNLPDKPEKPTSQEIADIIHPIPSGVNENAGCPTGMVGTFFGLTAPAGWLVCDGTKYNRTDYPALFTHLSTFPAERRVKWGNADWVDEFNVPNLLGEFPRFSGINGHDGEGNGASVGVHQAATRIPNMWTSNATANMAWYISKTYETSSGDKNMQIRNEDAREASTSYKAVTMKSTNYVENTTNKSYLSTRPTNTSFLPIIKY